METVTTIALNNLELTRFLFALVALLSLAHVMGYFFMRMKWPKVIGEICGGLLLGPTFLGHFSPSAYNWLFSAFESEGKLLSAIYWFGLILLMFLSGFEIQSGVSKKDRNIILALLAGATVIPFLGGLLAPLVYDFSPYTGIKNNILSLKIVIAVAVAVTSIPVISRIFIDLNMINTRFAKITLSAATIQDVFLWIALAIATGLVGDDHVNFTEIVSTILITLIFFGGALLIMPGLFRYVNKSRFNYLYKASSSGYVLLICFLFSALANILNVNVVFGAFLAGIIIGLLPNEEFEKQKKHIKEISMAFFVPIYFAIVGLKLDLIHHFDPVFFIGFLLFTTFLETFGVYSALRWIRYSPLSSFNFAVAMNTRGGPGIILASIAFELGIINETFFVTLVMVAMITSFMAGSWFKYVLEKKWEFIS